MNNDVIDITQLVEAMRQTFVTWGTQLVFGLEIEIPGMQWVTLPVISSLDKAAIKEILTLLSKSAVMEAFFINTSIRKQSQSLDYLSAVTVRSSLPQDATDDQYQAAEDAEMKAFANFVKVTN